jgi:Cdc6-like AAA superfamily ATPase
VEIGMDVKPISRHMVFTGNPGTGKTTFAREVAKIYHALGFLKSDKVVEATREDLIAEYTGQTAPKVRKKMDEARGGVLFIDEAYSLVRDKSAFRDVFGTEAIDTLVAGMENMRDEMVVIVAGYPEPMKKFIDANEGLKSRFVTYISFEDYSMGQLGEIMDLMAAERGYSLAADARDHVINLLEKEKAACEKKFRRADTDADGSSFGNARDVRTLVEAAEKALAFRLDSAGAFRPEHGMTAEERKALLSTITLADVAGLSLDGIKTPAGSARAQKAEIGFGRPRSSAPQL